MPTKFCNDAYDYQCENYVDYITQEDITKVFRLVKTHTGYYHRNVCKQCEAKKKMDQRKNNKYKKANRYDWWDYAERF